jgi:large subunit ribosomal protein L9
MQVLHWQPTHQAIRNTHFSMAKTEVILTSNIVGLGAESDHVKVAAGYARNYLLPQGLAIPLTAANKRRLESLRQRRAEREAHEFNTMNELGKSLQKLICLIKVKTGDDRKMFGSVTAGTIADELKSQFDLSLDKRKIHLEQPIRNLGEYEVEMRLHHEVKATLKVIVESLTPLPEKPEAAAGKGPEAGKAEGREGSRTEKRGWRFGPRPAVEGKAADAAKTPAEGRPARPLRPERKPWTPRPEHPAKPPQTEKPQ